MGCVTQFQMMRQKDVAEMLGMTESWVEQIRLRGGGPPFYKFGKSVRYQFDDVMAWVSLQKKHNTSQAA